MYIHYFFWCSEHRQISSLHFLFKAKQKQIMAFELFIHICLYIIMLHIIYRFFKWVVDEYEKQKYKF